MGTVYRAWHGGLEREVAVKVVDPRLSAQDPVMVQRFVREVGLLKRVVHPHVIKMIEAGHEGGLAYAVMELIVGQSLQRVKDDQPERRLESETAAFYMVQMARGLSAVHAHGIVHRDVKPANVIVDTRGQARIADFGLARGQDSSTLTRLDEVVGTPEYMAPETIEQDDVDGRADLYALGITGYELLTGDTPFHEGGVLRVVQDQVHAQAKPIRELVPDVPVGLAAVIERLMAKSPQARYPTAEAAAAALEEFAARQAPIVPTPEVRIPGARMPSWAELFLIRELVTQGRLTRDDVLGHLLGWHARRRRQPPFLVYLSEHAALGFAEGREAAQTAERGLIQLRNRIAYNRLRASDRVVQVDPAELRPGEQLPAFLARNERLSWDEAHALDRSVNRALRRATRKAIEAVCKHYAIEPGPLHELEKKLSRERFAEVYRWVVTALVRTL
jgi:serine/threonine protein kinase